MKDSVLVSTLAGLGLIASSHAAVLINEIDPNPPGTENSFTVELIATAGETTFDGFYGLFETDGTARSQNQQNNGSLSGSFIGGLLSITVSDVENPSFVLYVSTSDHSALDLDLDDDGTADNAAAFTTVIDAIQVIDTPGDATDYASSLGGVDFAHSGDEPQGMFRDRLTLDWYAVNDPAGTDVFDSAGNAVPGANFDTDPTGTPTTFGSPNPALIPEPSSLGLLGLAGLALILRRRK